MRLVLLGCLLVPLLTRAVEARRFTPGVAFTVSLQSDATGATATMTWQTRRICSQFQLMGFRCLGRWECAGDACPGRKGRLAFHFDPSRYHDVMLFLRGSLCTVRWEGVPGEVQEQPQQPPFHWRYRCFGPEGTTNQIDSGAALVELKPAP